MSVIRAFIAIEINPEITSQLARIADELQQSIGNHAVRWVPAENIHLTLKFLGDVSLNNLELLKDALKSEAAGLASFNISVGGIGAYPKIRSPRVLWVGVEGPETLISLQRSVENQMEKLGYERDRRNFSPHLTLGRVSRSAQPGEVRAVATALEAYKLGFIGISPVTAVHLFRSDLHPEGAVYSSLLSVPLDS